MARKQVILDDVSIEFLRSKYQKKGDLSLIVNYALHQLSAHLPLNTYPWHTKLVITKEMIDDAQFEVNEK